MSFVDFGVIQSVFLNYIKVFENEVCGFSVIKSAPLKYIKEMFLNERYVYFG